MKRSISVKWLVVVCLLLQFTISQHAAAQCTTVYNNMYDTLCKGDALFGYNTSGVYKDTFHLSNGCDSVRVLTLLVIPKIGTAPQASWFNTGSNGMGGRLPGSSQDTKWQIATDINGPYVPAIVLKTLPGPYVVSPWPDCTWISHSDTGTHMGNKEYYYKVEFILPCLDSCSQIPFEVTNTFCLSLDFYADNSVYEIYVNGVPQSSHIPQIPNILPYSYMGFAANSRILATMCSNWKRGYNSLIVHISSGEPYEAFVAQASISGNPYPPLKAAIQPVDSMCAPYAVNFVNKTTGANDYIWDFGDGSPQSKLENPSHVYYIPGVYKVSLHATSTAYCTFRAYDTSTYVTVLAPPPIDTIIAHICEGESYQFDGKSFNTAGIYTAIYNLPKGCDSVVRLNLIVHHAPLVFDSNILVIPSCKSWPGGKAFVSRSYGDTDSYTYKWTTADGNTIATTNNLSGRAGGTYYLEVTTLSGCKKTLKVVIPEEQISFEVDTLFCVDDIVNFKNTSDNNIICIWYFGDGDSSLDRNPSHTYTRPGVYNAKMIGFGAGCFDTIYHTIMVDAPVSDLFFSIDRRRICVGKEVHFTPHSENNTAHFLWSFGDGGSALGNNAVTYVYYKSGKWIITLTAQPRVCPLRTYIDSVYVDPLPLVDLGRDTIVCLPGEEFRLYNFADNQPGYQYLWSTGERTESIIVRNYGRYYLTLTSDTGCSITDSVEVERGCYLAIPNVFSPNGDGVNDYFFPRQLLSRNVVSFTMQVFNRWGQIIYETDNINGRGWDGKFNDTPQPQGVFVYLVDVAFRNSVHERYQGNVTLLR